MIDILAGFVGDREGSDFIRIATLLVPYFGTISVRSGRDKSAASAAAEQTESIAHSNGNSSSQNESRHHHAIPDKF
jgi:hypothetical protein